jgi:hypothetical protein
MLVNFGIKDLHIMPLSMCEFQAQELILGTSPATEARLLSTNPLNAELCLIFHLLALLGAHPILHVSMIRVNRTQSRVVTGLLTRHNTLRRHPYVKGLCNNHTCRKCGTEKETSVHNLYECETLASLRHANLSSFFLDPGNAMNLSTGTI